MKSPFPGMDPYLEAQWGDVHASIILYTRDQLEEQLPDDLLARVEERVVLETPGDDRAIYPDVKIAERVGRGASATAARRQLALVEPVVIEYEGDPATETYINILEAGPGQRLVTVIEVLSRSNKVPGEGQEQYRQKQRELAGSRVSLVEIDLLRTGQRVLNIRPARIPRRVRTTYQACVRRGWSTRLCEVYPMPLQASLPAIKIPLRQKDEDIQLDVQTVLDQAYRKGRYHLTIDDSKPPEPPLTGDDAKWARALLKKARRSKGA